MGMGLSIPLKAGIVRVAVGGHSSVVRAPAVKYETLGSIPVHAALSVFLVLPVGLLMLMG